MPQLDIQDRSRDNLHREGPEWNWGHYVDDSMMTFSVRSSPRGARHASLNPVSNSTETIPDNISGLGMNTPYGICLAVAHALATALAIIAVELWNTILAFVEA